MHIEPFFDPATWTLTYLVADPTTGDAVIVDPVLDFDPLTVSVSTRSNDRVVDHVRQMGWNVRLILETHAHADHLSGSQDLKRRLGGDIVIGEHIRTVQATFKTIFNLPDHFPTDGSQFDRLVADGETLQAGSLQIQVLHTPGHTPACVSYLIGDALFTGDALFMPDMGTGRCDFPAGSANDLYRSIQKIYALPDTTRVFVGHDYMPGGRELAWMSTIAEEKERNVQLPAHRSEGDFVAFRTARDATLQPPKLLFQSVQVNIAAGRMPEKESNGLAYLRLPISLFG